MNHPKTDFSPPSRDRGSSVARPAQDAIPSAENRPTPVVILVRDLCVFQVKLFLDGVKDIVLSPGAFWVGLLDILLNRSTRGSWFYKLLQLGERFERWLNLFEASDRMKRNGRFGGNQQNRSPPREADSASP